MLSLLCAFDGWNIFFIKSKHLPFIAKKVQIIVLQQNWIFVNGIPVYQQMPVFISRPASLLTTSKCPVFPCIFYITLWVHNVNQSINRR